MVDRLSIGFSNTRRANRVNWERPVQIVAPIYVGAKSINVSAVGILIATRSDIPIQVGEDISLDIPHLEGKDSIVVRGKVVRLERTQQDTRLAVNLT